MNATSTTEIQENDKKNIIYFRENRDVISFYNNEFLLFKHSKNSPLVSILLKKGNIRKEIPLQKLDVKKIGQNHFQLNFYYQSYHLNVRLKLVSNIFNIEVKNNNKYPIIKIELNNSTGRIRGLGLNKFDNCNNKNFQSNYFDNTQPKYVIKDNILTFTKKRKYFFNVVGSLEWQARFTKRMEFYIKNAYYFNINVIFGRDIEELHTKIQGEFENIKKFGEGKIIECRIEDVNNRLIRAKRNNEKISTIILDNEYIPFWELLNFKQKFIKSDINIIIKIMPKIAENDDYFNEFNENDFIKDNNDEPVFQIKSNKKFYFFNLSNQDTCRKIKNYLRRMFGTNIDGIMSIERENSPYSIESYKNKATATSEMWQTLIYESSKENYSRKILIFDKLTSKTPYYGFYLIPLKKAISKSRRKYIKNLRNSGVFNIVTRIKFAQKLQNRHIQNKLKQRINIITK